MGFVQDPNALFIKGKEIDDSAIADGKVLKYNSGTGKIDYATLGITGDTGVQGDTGVGVQGDTGVGTQGDTGVGVQGDTGVGTQGDTGVGTQGDTGVGVQGDTGVGTQGDTGVGTQGDTGVGVQGDTGVGTQGDTGVGTQGDTGVGTQGDTGVGTQGDTGVGTQGDTGVGVQGDTGVGTQGDTGTGGAKGDTGNAGATGTTGATGATGGAWTSRVLARRNDDQTIQTETDTKVQLNVEVFDGASEFDAATNYRFTAGSAGYYFVSGWLRGNADTSGKVWLISIKINGSTAISAGSQTGANNDIGVSCSGVLYLAASEYIEMYVYHDEGGDRTLLGHTSRNGGIGLSIHRLS